MTLLPPDVSPPIHIPIPHDALCWRRSFTARADQAGEVRAFVEFLVAGCPKADEAVFAANEFFGNAINHTESKHAGGLVVVELRRWRGHCAVLVTDQGGDSEPQTQGDGDPLSEHGRGLRAVGATATSWGWYGNRQSRTVTAVFTQ